jgi:hypothetical protein
MEEPGRGNESGTASQIRPHAVSVWVGVLLGPLGGDAVSPPGTGVSSAVGGGVATATDGAEDGRDETATSDGVPTEVPQAATNNARRTGPTRGETRVTGSS